MEDRLDSIEIAEEVISLICDKGKVTIKDIQNYLNLTKETTIEFVDFLIIFGFVVRSDDESYLSLSAPMKRFLTQSDDQNLFLDKFMSEYYN